MMTSLLPGSPAYFGRPSQSKPDAPGPVRLAHVAHLQRHGTHVHTGYPFMQLAKKTGADYGDVLSYAQYATARQKQWKDTDDATDEDRAMIRRLSTQVCDRVRCLVALPVHLRGGDHFP